MSYKIYTNLICDQCGHTIDYAEGHCVRLLRRGNLTDGGQFYTFAKCDGAKYTDVCKDCVERPKKKGGS